MSLSFFSGRNGVDRVCSNDAVFFFLVPDLSTTGVRHAPTGHYLGVAPSLPPRLRVPTSAAPDRDGSVNSLFGVPEQVAIATLWRSRGTVDRTANTGNPCKLWKGELVRLAND